MEKLIMNESLGFYPFVVNDKTFCVVDFDLYDRNLEVIKGFQEGYFEYAANIHEKELSGENRKLAATSLRSSYVQGLETFFALLFATLQAPACIGGWLSQYKIGDLRELAKSVKLKGKILSRVPLAECSWKGIAEAIHQTHKHKEQEKHLELINAVSKLWSTFANDFLNNDIQQEYNSIKHGLRTQFGGFHLAVAPETTPDAKPKDSDYISLGGSNFGSAFLKAEDIGHKHHFRIRRFRLNWHPSNTIASLRLISRSISNIIAFLKTIHGDKTTQMFWPSNEEEFNSIRKVHVGMISIGLDSPIEPSYVTTPYTPEEIRAEYEQTN